MSQKIRKRIEEAFGWIKTVAGQRKTRFKGRDRGGWMGLRLRRGGLQPGPPAQAGRSGGMPLKGKWRIVETELWGRAHLTQPARIIARELIARHVGWSRRIPSSGSWRRRATNALWCPSPNSTQARRSDQDGPPKRVQAVAAEVAAPVVKERKARVAKAKVPVPPRGWWAWKEAGKAEVVQPFALADYFPAIDRRAAVKIGKPPNGDEAPAPPVFRDLATVSQEIQAAVKAIKVSATLATETSHPVHALNLVLGSPLLGRLRAFRNRGRQEHLLVCGGDMCCEIIAFGAYALSEYPTTELAGAALAREVTGMSPDGGPTHWRSPTAPSG